MPPAPPLPRHPAWKVDRVKNDRMRSLLKELPSAAVFLALAVFLSGCRVDEQDRQVSLEKGIYQGQKDTPLSEEQRRELRERSLLGQ